MKIRNEKDWIVPIQKKSTRRIELRDRRHRKTLESFFRVRSSGHKPVYVHIRVTGP